jgi:hypothetical protein
MESGESNESRTQIGPPWEMEQARVPFAFLPMSEKTPGPFMTAGGGGQRRVRRLGTWESSGVWLPAAAAAAAGSAEDTRRQSTRA